MLLLRFTAALALLFLWPGGGVATEPSEVAAAVDPLAESLSASVRLADWDIKHAEDIAYASIGILRTNSAKRLVVYDLRKRVPAPKPRPTVSRSPSLEQGYFLIDHFAGGIRNRLGGYSSSFARAPSRGELTVAETPDGRRALSFQYLRTADGFSGFWIHTFDFKSPERVMLDARDTAFLTFRIRGATGHERLVLGSADDAWERKGDSIAIGDVGEFLASGRIDASWQQAWVPLERIPERLDRSRLASFVFSAEEPGSGTVFVRDMALAAARETNIPEATIEAGRQKPLRKSMWVWETEKIAADDRELSDLISFCRDRKITDVYLQIPEKGPARLRHVIAGLHGVGLRVAALDGDPRFALAANHARVLAAIEQVLRYNDAAQPSERYDAVRYDNEPYLLPGFAGAHKEKILRDYLRLIEKARELTQPAGLRFGVDIPFWFDARNRFMEPVAALDGRPLSELVIDNVDEVAIMDYRTIAYGPDGVIAHASDELRYAAKLGKPVYVGLETVELPDETILDFTADGQGARLLVGDAGDGRIEIRWIPEMLWPRLKDAAVARDAERILSQTFVAEAPSSKVSFSHWPAERLKRVIEETARELADVPSFAGFALHSYESYRPWLSAEREIH